ncbi:TIGR03757 family integrating conjugative element protein [Actinobacillus pleuropneumoniae]|uniref:TIGR03757 family integrating conjugative element protein n=1 Tax=Actinobacillus pleuropneumoniae TaxID=715 RepID=UPI003B01D111
MCFRYIVGLAGVFPALLWAEFQRPIPDTSITVYTTQAYPIQQTELANAIYLIDGVDNLENVLAQRLSSTPDIAERQIGTFFNSAEGMKYQKQLQDAYVGVIEAWQTGVMKVPAIVFDDRKSEPSVIYGETNVSKAIQLYKTSLRGKY